MTSNSFTYVDHLANRALDVTAHSEFENLLSNADFQNAQEVITSWPGYEPTDLIALDDFARDAKVSAIWYKDESSRFGLGSFKSLGGSYAVAVLADEYRAANNGLDGFSVATATDGNHGRSVAWGAQRLGIECNIFVHSQVSQQRVDYMSNLGATVHRVAGNYDDSLVACERAAKQNGWQIVSDTSWDGYETVPLKVMAGYSVMAKEIVQQLGGEIPTHVFIPAGCGGLAGGMLAYFWQVWREQLPRIVLVESHMSACMLQSLDEQKIKLVHIVEETVMAGLSCGEVSKVIWPLLQKGVSDVVTIPDDGVIPIIRSLAYPAAGCRRRPIEGGECSTAGLAVLLAARSSEQSDLRSRLGLDEDSKALVLGTEGATDPDFYQSAIANG